VEGNESQNDPKAEYEYEFGYDPEVELGNEYENDQEVQ